MTDLAALMEVDAVEDMRARFLRELATHVAVRRALVASWLPAPMPGRPR